MGSGWLPADEEELDEYESAGVVAVVVVFLALLIWGVAASVVVENTPQPHGPMTVLLQATLLIVVVVVAVLVGGYILSTVCKYALIGVGFVLVNLKARLDKWTGDE